MHHARIVEKYFPYEGRSIMQISVSGKNMDMGNAFQEHAQTSLNAIVEKYFHNAVSGTYEGRSIMTRFQKKPAD